MNMTSSGLQCEVALGGAAQVRLIARTNGLWTPQSAAITDPSMPQPAALWPSPRNVLRQLLAIFSNEYYQILIATHLPAPKGWKAELA